MDIKTASPAAIDAELARIGVELAAQQRILNDAMRAQASQKAGRIYPGTYNEAELRKTIARAADRMAELAAERFPYEREFETRGGWDRYYLVDSSDGHVHRDASRSRCSRTPSTTHMWLTSESGRPPADVVKDAGERACTNCYPWAPVEDLARPSKYVPTTELERQARAAEREARALARKAKAITATDGGPLRVKLGGYWETIKTERAAELKALEIQFDARWQRRAATTEELDALNVIVEALAAKQRKDQGTVRTDLEVRLIKKCQREGVRF